MGLNIKNEETVRLVRELADALHVSMTAAITQAVEARLAQLQGEGASVDEEARRILAIWAEMGERMGKEYLSQDFDALLYDGRGLPK
jgi:hypothetical protein